MEDAMLNFLNENGAEPDFFHPCWENLDVRVFHRQEKMDADQG